MSASSNPALLETDAMQAYQRGDHSLASDLFQQAQRAYQTRGDTLKAAEMANNRSVSLLQAGHAQAALDAVEGTPELFQQLGHPLEAAQAVGNVAAAQEELGDLHNARKSYQECARMLGDLGASELQSGALQALSRIQLKSGQPLPALAAMEASLEAQPQKNIRNRLLKRLLSIPDRMLKR